MSLLGWHRWHHAAWLGSETRYSMSLTERGLYRDLLDLHYAEGSIPSDPVILCRMLGVDADEFGVAWPVVRRCFRVADDDAGRLVNDKALEVISRAEKYRAAQSAKGRMGGRPRRSKSRGKATALPELNRSLTVVKPKDSPPTGESQQSSLIIEPEGSNDGVCGFDSWWSVWPKKAAKVDARKAYRSVVVEGRLPAGATRDDFGGLDTAAARHARLMATAVEWAAVFRERPLDKVPHGATFLRRLDWVRSPERRRGPGSEERMLRADDELRRSMGGARLEVVK